MWHKALQKCYAADLEKDVFGRRNGFSHTRHLPGDLSAADSSALSEVQRSSEIAFSIWAARSESYGSSPCQWLQFTILEMRSATAGGMPF